MTDPVFISYSHDTGEFHASNLHHGLEQAGVSAFLDRTSLKHGDSIPEGVFEAVLGARVLVAFIDSRYVTRRYCVEELATALSASDFLRRRGAADDEVRAAVRPVVVALGTDPGRSDEMRRLPPEIRNAKCPVATETRALVELVTTRLGEVHQTFADRLRDLGELDSVRDRLAESMVIPPPRERGRVPTYPESGLAGSIADAFVGRASDLWELHSALASQPSGAAVLTTVLEGGGGFGKTRLAIEYLHRYASQTHEGGLFWVDADVPADRLDGQLHGILRVLRPATPELRDFAALGLDLRRELGAALREQSRTGRILYVVDNVPEPQDAEPPQALTAYCPAPSHVSLLVTSRARQTIAAGMRRFVVRELSPESAVRLLTRGVDARHATPEQWREIAEWVGHLPLVLELLNAALRVGTITPSELRAALRQGGGPTQQADLGMEALRPVVPPESLRGVSEALAISYRRLPKGARAAAHVLAWLSPVAIPARVVADGELFSRQVRGLLRARSFVTEVGSGSVEMYGRMHRVLADYLRGMTGGAEGELSLNRACATLLGIMRPEAMADPANWPLLDASRPHAEAVLDRCLPPGGPLDLLGFTLGMALSAFLRLNGKFDASLRWAERCRDGAVASFGAEDGIALVARLNAADARRAAGELSLARERLEELLEPLARAAGDEDPSTLAARLMLAATLHAQGELEPARELLDELLAVHRRLHGPAHRETMPVMTQLGLTLFQQGDLTRSRAVLEEALESAPVPPGQTNPQVLAVMSSLAATMAQQGDVERSTALLERVLDAGGKVLAPEHPVMLLAAVNLAVNRNDAGDLDGAVQLLRQVAEASDGTFDAEHPDALGITSNLAAAMAATSHTGVVADQARVEQAAKLRRQVLAASRRILGDRHPLTLAATVNMADSLRTEGDLAGAGRLAEQAVRDSTDTLGPDHQMTLDARAGLATVLQSQGEWDRAIAIREEVLDGRRAAFGPEHPHTLLSTSALASALVGAGQRQRARDILEDVHVVADRVLGEAHPNALAAALSLANLALEDGDFARARVLGEHILAICERTLGPDHPRTLVVKAYLGPVLIVTGETELARKLNESLPKPAPGSQEPIELVFARALTGGQGTQSVAVGDMLAALELSRSMLGPEDPTTLAALAGVGMLLVNRGEHTRAIELLEPALPAMRRALGAYPQVTVGMLFALAGAYQMAGEAQKARVLFEEIFETSQVALGDRHPFTLMATAVMAARRHAEGGPAEARESIERAVQTSRQVLGEDSIVTRALAEAMARFPAAEGEA